MKMNVFIKRKVPSIWRVCLGVKKEQRETWFSEKGHTRERVSEKSQRQRGRTAVWQSKKRNRENWVRRGRYKPNRKTRVNWASEVETKKHITVFQDNPATTLNPNKKPRQFYLENCSLLPSIALLIKSEAREREGSGNKNLNNLNSPFSFFFFNLSRPPLIEYPSRAPTPPAAPDHW